MAKRRTFTQRLGQAITRGVLRRERERATARRKAKATKKVSQVKRKPTRKRPAGPVRPVTLSVPFTKGRRAPQIRPTVPFQPEVEVVGRIRIRTKRRRRETARRAAFAARRAVWTNIDTQYGGTWPPLVCRTGRALETRKRDWTVSKTEKGYRVAPEPFWWVTHLEGRIIRPKKAKVLRFWCEKADDWVFARYVVVPRRDPRPTVQQIRREFR